MRNEQQSAQELDTKLLDQVSGGRSGNGWEPPEPKNLESAELELVSGGRSGNGWEPPKAKKQEDS